MIVKDLIVLMWNKLEVCNYRSFPTYFFYDMLKVNQNQISGEIEFAKGQIISKANFEVFI